MFLHIWILPIVSKRLVDTNYNPFPSIKRVKKKKKKIIIRLFFITPPAKEIIAISDNIRFVRQALQQYIINGKTTFLFRDPKQLQDSSSSTYFWRTPLSAEKSYTTCNKCNRSSRAIPSCDLKWPCPRVCRATVQRFEFVYRIQYVVLALRSNR